MTRSLVGLCLLVGVLACDKPKIEKPKQSPKVEKLRVRDEPLSPIPPPKGLAPGIVALGERLFFDPKLSTDNTISCGSCHDISKGGDDGRVVSLGIKARKGAINSPTVLNAALNFAQFWDGRAQTLEEQIDGPIQADNEMGSQWPEVVKKIKADSSYASQFRKHFPKRGVSRQTIKIAIATYERSLVTPDGAFDRWLKGDPKALSDEQLAGYKLFKAVGCVACHQGANVGGNLYQRFGVLGDYFKDRGKLTEADNGRFNVTKQESDRHVFKVPSLRNVEHTAPYFHDGSAKTLEDAVRVMARYQLGRKLSDKDIARLVAFLKSLSGELPKAPG